MNKKSAGARIKIIKSGDTIEMEIFPIYKKSGRRLKHPEKESREAQKKLNKKNAAKNIDRLIRCNFTEGRAFFITLTYMRGFEREKEEAKADIKKFLREIRKIKKDLRYIYCTGGYDEKERAEKKGKIRIHHHLIINYADVEKMGELWKFGQIKAEPIYENKSGYRDLAEYMLKEEHGRANTSRGLKRPEVKTYDNYMGVRAIKEMLLDTYLKRKRCENILKMLHLEKNGEFYFEEGAGNDDFLEGIYGRVKFKKEIKHEM